MICNKSATKSGTILLGLSAIIALFLLWTVPLTASAAQPKGGKKKAKAAAAATVEKSDSVEEQPSPEEELPPEEAPPPEAKAATGKPLPPPDGADSLPPDGDLPPPVSELPPEPGDDLPPPVSEEDWLAAAEADQIDEPVNRPPAPAWMLVVAPFGGFLHNQTRVKFRIPQSQEEGTVTYLNRSLNTEDNGWGLGAMAMFRMGVFTLNDVFFLFPRVGDSQMIGNIAMLNVLIPTSERFQPYLGGGLAFTDIRVGLDSYSDTSVQDITNSNGDVIEKQTYQATISDFDLHAQSIAPIAEIGMRLNLPIQHWSITPLYQYTYASTWSRAMASRLDLLISSDSGEDPADLHWPGFASTKKEWHEAHTVGAKIFLDFYYFLQLGTEILWNLSDQRIVARINLNVMFTKHMGVVAFFEHAELENTTNTYVMLGPTFLFTPRGYFAKLEEYKKNKKNGTLPQEGSTPTSDDAPPVE